MEEEVIMETGLAEVPQKRGRIARGLVCIVESGNLHCEGKTHRCCGLSGSWEKMVTCQRSLEDRWALRSCSAYCGGSVPIPLKCDSQWTHQCGNCRNVVTSSSKLLSHPGFHRGSKNSAL